MTRLENGGRLKAFATITDKSLEAEAVSYSGELDNGNAYYRYSRLGRTCEGNSVLGSFELSYPPSEAATYAPMVEILVQGFYIGACG